MSEKNLQAEKEKKQLVMVDSGGNCCSLKLATGAGLHFYDGQMLWINPADTVTAAAPKPLKVGEAPPAQKKALPIIDPQSGEEIVLPKQSPALKPASFPPAPVAVAVGASPALMTPSSLSLLSMPMSQLLPQNLFPPLMQQLPMRPPTQSLKVFEILAQATQGKDLEHLQNMSPFASGNREEGREFSKGGRGRGRRGMVADGRGRGGDGSRPEGQQPRAARRPEPNGNLYSPPATYTASLDGRFWSLSEWPTGTRDEVHRLSFGKHKLNVEKDGTVKVVLFGGVNRYRVKLHLSSEDDELGARDVDGWTVAVCGSNTADFALTSEAEKLGWKVGWQKTEAHLAKLPSVFPPGLEVPESMLLQFDPPTTKAEDEDAGVDSIPAENDTKVEVVTTPVAEEANA